MKRAIVLFGIFVLLSGGAGITSLKKQNKKADIDLRFMQSADSLKSASYQLEAATLKLKKLTP